MPKPRNIVVTGSRGAGKTTLVNWLLEQIHLPCDGFQTLQYRQTPIGPLYEMADLSTGLRMPISQLRAGRIQGIPETFDTFGTDLLHRAEAPILLMDEIGRFERNSPDFLSAVFAGLEGERIVIAVVKKEPLPHLQAICRRRDILLLDLDDISRETARQLLHEWLRKDLFLR